jgi:dihydroorotate dehydrogenase electron transfer subunit
VPTGFTVLSKRVGIGTTRLYDTRPGDRLACLGPLGRPFTVVSPPSEAWLIAGGVGLAPFATLVEALRARGTRTTLFYGARTSAELHCLDTFVGTGIDIVTATEDGTHGVQGLVTAPLADRLGQAPPDRDVHLFTCGPTPMMRAVARLAAAAGRPCAVSLEQVMGCGMGGCYSCVVRVRQPDGSLHFVRSCVEGPVFDSAMIVWEEAEAFAHA